MLPEFQEGSSRDYLQEFIMQGNELTRQNGSAAYGMVEDILDQFLPQETVEQTARCIGQSSLGDDLDKLL